MVGKGDDVKSMVFVCLDFFETLKAILMLWSGQTDRLSWQYKLKTFQYDFSSPAWASYVHTPPFYHDRNIWFRLLSCLKLCLHWSMEHASVMKICLGKVYNYIVKPTSLFLQGNCEECAYITYTRSRSTWNKIENGIDILTIAYLFLWISGKSATTE